ncbi:MAG: hypothetical protein JWN33_50 [Candidatus Saccharibacteria bacterium]|nr:hypothetical protein [Candidatus Saccharibacteria bacterium]
MKNKKQTQKNQPASKLVIVILLSLLSLFFIYVYIRSGGSGFSDVYPWRIFTTITMLLVIAFSVLFTYAAFNRAAHIPRLAWRAGTILAVISLFVIVGITIGIIGDILGWQCIQFFAGTSACYVSSLALLTFALFSPLALIGYGVIACLGLLSVGRAIMASKH